MGRLFCFKFGIVKIIPYICNQIKRKMYTILITAAIVTILLNVIAILEGPDYPFFPIGTTLIGLVTGTFFGFMISLLVSLGQECPYETETKPLLTIPNSIQMDNPLSMIKTERGVIRYVFYIKDDIGSVVRKEAGSNQLVFVKSDTTLTPKILIHTANCDNESTDWGFDFLNEGHEHYTVYLPENSQVSLFTQ